MFFIVNKTKQRIVIGDIKITLGPRQAIDLDRLMKRAKSEESQHLRAAVSRGQVEIRIKDNKKPRHPSKAVKVPSINLDGMKNDIINEMKETMKELLAQQGQGSNSISREDLEKMAQTIVKSMPKSTKETVIIREGEQSTDEKVEMDGETLATISARVVDEMAKNAELKTVHYEEEQQENTILDNVDELESLLE